MKQILLAVFALLMLSGAEAAQIFPPTIEWQTSSGGTGDDWVSCVRQTSDNGFVVGGYSNSGMGGNKTSTNFGQFDFWVIRLDQAGHKLWDHSFGGDCNDTLSDLRETADGGFMLAGTSCSLPGSGNKISANLGQDDFWVVRLDAQGNKLWDKTFGGSDHDRATALEQTIDGGWIVGGYSYSNADGNKTAAQLGPEISGSCVWTLMAISFGINLSVGTTTRF